ncbi:MAG: 2,3-diphosphoglycerate-dependent phosphoglycerate mutase [Oceanicaulis sp.]|nr:2,3-diphosphoglycerate-dependent phosphoglycerate mutase [Oceanicaulis sp.]
MTRLVLTRHGQSVWNKENRFTGWVDVDLTDAGVAEARRGGELLKAEGFEPSLAFTSVLKRAIRTLNFTLEGIDRLWIPVEKSWRLNERHYGALTGMNKAEVTEEHGADQVKIWRRSYDTPPPPLPLDDPRHPRFDPRYGALDPDALPAGESLKLTLERVAPYFKDAIAPRLEAGEDVIISAHGNSLRALVKLLFNVADSDIVGIEIPTGNPLLIELEGLRPVARRFLDEARAQDLPPCP